MEEDHIDAQEGQREVEMAEDLILWSRDGAVVTLTFNRPEKLNALNPPMWDALAAILERVAADRTVRVLIVTGAGRAFIAGADVSLFLDFDPLAARSFILRGQEVLARIERLEIPVIASVNGFALGGGCELAMACDFIYASEQAKFGQPEINLGIIPGLGGATRLGRLVGKGRAKELCLTGRLIDAAEARDIGLVSRLFPPEELLAETRKAAHGMAARGRVALRTLKQVIDRGLEVDLHSGLGMEADGFALCFACNDPKEGAAAFLEKRPPRFTS